MKHIRIRLIKDVAIYDNITYNHILTYKKGQELNAYDESADAYFVGPGYGIWKTEAELIA